MVHMWQRGELHLPTKCICFHVLGTRVDLLNSSLWFMKSGSGCAFSPSFLSLQRFASGLIANLKVMIYRSGSPHGAHTYRDTHTHVHAYAHAWVSKHMERVCNTGSRARSSAGNIPGPRKHKWKWLELGRFEETQDQRGKVVNFRLISKKATSFHKSLDHLQPLDGSNCKLSRCYYLFTLWFRCKSQTILSRTNT